MKTAISSASNLAQLTSLRFFAAAYVLVFHSGTTTLERAGAPTFIINFLKNGYLGVAFFFILSGFILTHSYFGKVSNCQEIKRFAVARFARIYPVYILALLIALPLTSAPFDSPSLALATLGLVQSWGFPSSANGFFWNAPGWTLSVEFVFYLLFPIVLPIVSRFDLRALWCGLAATILVLTAMRSPGLAPQAGDKLAFAWMNAVPLPLLRTPEFISGIFCARLFQLGAFHSLKRDIAAVAAGVLTLLALVSTNGDWASPMAAIGFLAIIATCSVNEGTVKTSLSSPLLVLLGSASYALYILQTPVRSWVAVIFTGDQDWLGRILYQPMLVVISIGVFILIEEPARKLLRRKSAPQHARVVA